MKPTPTKRTPNRLLSALGVRQLTLEEALGRLERMLGEAGTITISIHDERRPRMDLTTLIERWRRMAGHLESNPGRLTAAEVYELCADELEARIRTHELQQREQEAVQA